jgi:hypothetical protein
MPVRAGLPRQCAHDFCDAICQANDGTREFTVTCLACPLSITGHVDGIRFYFRARHDKWRIEIPDEGPSEIIASGPGDDFTEGQAVDLIVKRVSQWIYG